MAENTMTLVGRCALQMATLCLGVAAVASAQANNKNKVTAPTNVAVASTASALTVNWTAVSGAASYVVNQRTPSSAVVTQLAAPLAPPYSGSLPAPGSTFEYQVVAISKSGQAPSAWIAYTVPAVVTTAPVTAVLMPTTTTATAIPIASTTTTLTKTGTTSLTTFSGPATLTASSDYTSDVGARVFLTWSAVNGASGYRIGRVNNAGEAERTIYEGPSNDFMYTSGTFTPTWGEVDCNYASGDPWWYCKYKDTGLVRGVLYSYRVFALFDNGVVSPSSPVVSVVAGGS